MSYKQTPRDLAWAVAFHMYEYAGRHPDIWTDEYHALWLQFYNIGMYLATH